MIRNSEAVGVGPNETPRLTAKRFKEAAMCGERGAELLGHHGRGGNGFAVDELHAILTGDKATQPQLVVIEQCIAAERYIAIAG